MRTPRPIEIVVALAAAAVVGIALGASRKKPPPKSVVVVDSGVGTFTDTPRADAGFAEETIDAFAGFTVDDDHAPEPPDPQTTDIEKLIALIPIDSRTEENLASARNWIGPGRSHVSQGNPEISTHSITRAQCKERLRGVILQTPLQREICGAPWEVPLHSGDPSRATTCIDAFEYPNRPCVLPYVFSHSIAARRLCALSGKRLCTQEEWNVACEADPKGGPPRKYAYGDELDLKICHTGQTKSYKCDVDNALWKSCPSDTVPTGSFPQCKSRLGVFDQHGNVAEAMTRLENRVNYVQLKGSAFFYDGEIYADHCRFDPRWHVDPAEESFHTNYHLGFRCCRSVVPLADRGKPDASAPEVSVPGWNPTDAAEEPAVEDADENPYEDDADPGD